MHQQNLWRETDPPNARCSTNLPPIIEALDMLSLRTTPAEDPFGLMANTADMAALSASHEAAAVVAGYRALQADSELHQHEPGSAARTERMLTVLTPVADAWGISARELINAVGRGVE